MQLTCGTILWWWVGCRGLSLWMVQQHRIRYHQDGSVSKIEQDAEYMIPNFKTAVGDVQYCRRYVGQKIKLQRRAARMHLQNRAGRKLFSLPTVLKGVLISSVIILSAYRFAIFSILHSNNHASTAIASSLYIFNSAFLSCCLLRCSSFARLALSWKVPYTPINTLQLHTAAYQHIEARK